MSGFGLGLIVLLYFLVLAYLGWLGYKNTADSKDFLIAGGDTHPVMMALAYGATFISASALVGFGGVSAAYGMGIEWLCLLNILMGVIVAYIFFGRRTQVIGKRLEAHTFAEFLGKYYESNFVKYFVAAVIFLTMPLYAAVVLKGGAVFIEEMFKIDFNLALLLLTLVVAGYVIAGGMKSVVYTDVLQACIMVGSILFLAYWFFFREMGMGFAEANRALSDMSHLVPEKFQALGHVGWTSMPSLGSPQWYTLVTSLILGVGIGCLAQPQLVVRFMTVKGTKELNRGVLIGTVFLVLTVGIMYHIGALSNLYFYKTTGMVATDVSPDIDKIIPLFINSFMPGWFSAVFMLCVISAAMSTLSSQFHTMGAAVGRDIYSGFTRRDNWPKELTRAGVLFTILVSYVICYVLSASVIARGTSLFMGICAATFLPIYFAALFLKKKISVVSVKWSLWTGLLTSFFALVFLHRSEAAALGICKVLFGKEVLIEKYPWYMIDPLLFALPLSIMALIIAELVVRRKSGKNR
ncbi:MAG: sodium:solute symporter family protein [Bacteroidales bacterium]|jgi:SSS family solute:Na+ symporter